MNRLQLLEHVNGLNMRAAINNTGKTYWTVTVLYNTVVYERDQDGVVAMHETIEGVPKSFNLDLFNVALQRMHLQATNVRGDAVAHGDRKGRWFAEGQKDAIESVLKEANK